MMLPVKSDPVVMNTITAVATKDEGMCRSCSSTMGRMPSRGVILPAKYAGTITPHSDSIGPIMDASINGPGVIKSGGIELEYTLIIPAVSKCAPTMPSTMPNDRAGHAHGKSFQDQHPHDLLSCGADGAEDRQLPAPLAHVHQERVEDHEDRQHDVQPKHEGQALLCVLERVLRHLHAGRRRADLQARGQGGGQFGLGLLFIGVGFQDDVRAVDAVPSFGIIVLSRADGQENHAASG